MKVIFLDIDGVLNNDHTTARFQGYLGIDPILAARFRRILRITGAQVVLSSTWRLYRDHREEVKRIVCDYIGVTDNERDGFRNNFRGDEVKRYVLAHPEITKYCCLDDNNDFYPDQNLFQTSFSEGLTEEIADEVIQFLDGMGLL